MTISPTEGAPCDLSALNSSSIGRRKRRTSLGHRTFACNDCRRIFSERTRRSFNRLQYPTDTVMLVVLWRLRYKLSLRDVAEMLQRGFTVTHETIRAWEFRFAPIVADSGRADAADGRHPGTSTRRM